MAEASGESERTLKGKRKEIAGGIGPYELKINLAALRRSASDDTILEIVGTASQVALYSFNGKSWQKTDAEGTLFVYRRSGCPTHGFFIMNRLSTENVQYFITPTMEFQTQEPFVLYKSANRHIFGIWFYDTAEFKDVGNLIVKLSRGGQATVTAKPEETSTMTKSPQLHQLLTNGAGSTAPSQPRIPAKPHQIQPIISNIQTPIETARAKPTSQVSLAALDPAIMALPSSLADMSVSMSKHQPTALASTNHVAGRRDQQTTVTSKEALKQLVATTLPRSDPIGPQRLTVDTPPSTIEAQRSTLDVQRGTLDALPVPLTTTQLRSPLDFQPLGQKQTDSQHGCPVQEANGQHTAGTSSLKRHVPALNKEQMQQAMLYLIQNDSSFVDVLHDAYIKSIDSFSSQ